MTKKKVKEISEKSKVLGFINVVLKLAGQNEQSEENALNACRNINAMVAIQIKKLSQRSMFVEESTINFDSLADIMNQNNTNNEEDKDAEELWDKFIFALKNNQNFATFFGDQDIRQVLREAFNAWKQDISSQDLNLSQSKVKVNSKNKKNSMHTLDSHECVAIQFLIAQIEIKKLVEFDSNNPTVAEKINKITELTDTIIISKYNVNTTLLLAHINFINMLIKQTPNLLDNREFVNAVYNSLSKVIHQFSKDLPFPGRQCISLIRQLSESSVFRNDNHKMKELFSLNTLNNRNIRLQGNFTTLPEVSLDKSIADVARILSKFLPGINTSFSINKLKPHERNLIAKLGELITNYNGKENINNLHNILIDIASSNKKVSGNSALRFFTANTKSTQTGPTIGHKKPGPTRGSGA